MSTLALSILTGLLGFPVGYYGVRAFMQRRSLLTPPLFARGAEVTVWLDDFPYQAHYLYRHTAGQHGGWHRVRVADHEEFCAGDELPAHGWDITRGWHEGAMTAKSRRVKALQAELAAVPPGDYSAMLAIIDREYGQPVKYDLNNDGIKP